MNRSQFLRLSSFAAVGASFLRPGSAFGAIDFNFSGTPAGLRPYLHAPRPDSMRVSWWTDSDADTFIDYGVDGGPLNQTVTGSRTVMGSGYHYHAGQITGLQPDTYYEYRVRTENVTSATFRFRTPKPLGTSTGRFRVLVLGDNQIIDPSQRRFERLVERAKKKVEDLYGVPIEEAIDVAIMPGDQVDVGTLNHYRNLHFEFNGWISPYIPIMTTIGNHETYQDPGLANYKTLFTYDDFTCAGVSSPDPEVYYAYQLANVAFVHTSSEHTGATQTGWVQNLVDAAEADSGIDWMISLCHRPYQAEQYIGDISGWLRNTAMQVFAQTGKHVLNIGAHHHIYARGQTRDWPIYHIISGGSSWDQFWGQSNEADYDDVQKTLAHWAWQLIEFDLDARTMNVKCFAEANVKFPTATRWSYNSLLVDEFSRKLGVAAPGKPSLTNSEPAPITLPLTLQSAAFSTSTSEVLNSTWFQVATDASFLDLKVDRLRDVENIYGDTGAPDYTPIDTHDGVDILQYELPVDSLADGTYFARVRHRDSNVEWSEWSTPLEFEVTGSGFTGDPEISIEKKVYALNEDVQVNYSGGPGLAQDWIGIYRKGDTPGSGTASTAWSYVDGSSGVLNFTQNLPEGEWYVAFFTDDGYAEIAPRVPFYVGDEPTLTPNKESFDEGETVEISYAGAPAGDSDWIGIYREGDTPGTELSTDWDYLNGTRTPGTAGEAGTLSFNGLPKGYYFADYFLNGGYTGIAQRVRFSVGTEISQVSMASATVRQGEDFTVDFTDGPGTPKDWMGIFKQGETPGEDVLTAYLYVDGNTTGSVTFELPELPPGDYFLALFINDSYTEVSNRFLFTVTPEVPFRIEQSALDGSEMKLWWQSESGVPYQIQRSTDLTNWVDVLEMVGTGSLMQAAVAVDLGVRAKEYFRITRP
ncbi:fibronectin type III domain-containing protein [Haloferula rosea]|uniref:Fibronectin type III domain-containing protein n=1 Tax=Haloferula rosea TaxID=490093 RepID=A0A934R963_9BACT|nr:fibronectin type III domain-containing protein [Haloferula rosea]MBK1826642.1 fibronectin type III domain-containing protein [Haloferula rosea]